jgi:3-phosphoshikimate 1-carboxyvinyltransferase
MIVAVNGVARLRGRLRPPGDKSIAHRALILGAIAEGRQVAVGVPESADLESTLRCLSTLGFRVERSARGVVSVDGGGPRRGVAVDAGNSGTTARLLCGLIAGCGIEGSIDGDESLRRRPMDRVVRPLKAMGARLTAAPGERLPIRVRAGDLVGIRWELPVASAQAKSAVLVAGLYAEGETTVVEPTLSRDHTERMLECMGVEVRREGRSVSVRGGQRPKGVQVLVPGDPSSAAFFGAAAAALPGSEVRIDAVSLNPTRAGVWRVLERMGARVDVLDRWEVSGEPLGDLLVRGGPLRGTTIEPEEIPTLLDELPVLAVIATRAEGPFVVRGAEELRVKESDRIHAIVSDLRRLGARVEERSDGFVLHGPCRLRGAPVASFGDHRVAMAMVVAGLLAEATTRVVGAEAIGVSYPDFLRDLRRLVQ